MTACRSVALCWKDGRAGRTVLLSGVTWSPGIELCCALSLRLPWHPQHPDPQVAMPNVVGFFPPHHKSLCVLGFQQEGIF